MPEIPFRYVFVRQKMEGGEDTQSLLSHPGLCRLVQNELVPSADLVDRTSDLVAEMAPYNHFRLCLPQTIHSGCTTVRIDAPEKVPGWKNSFSMPVQYLWWEVDSRYKVALIPVAETHAIAVGAGEIENEVRREFRNSILRNAAGSRLNTLTDLSRFGELSIVEYEAVVPVPTPREVEDKENQSEKSSTLESIARRLNARALRPAWLIEPQVRQLAEKLAEQRPESVLLTGPSGCGKSATFESLVTHKALHGLQDVEFWQTDGSRLVAGMSGFGQWQQRCTDLINELEKKRAVIHFGNLVELIETGRGGSSQQGIAEFLRPYLVRGKITAIAECTADQLAVVAKQSPQMLDAFHQIPIAPPDATRTGEILLEIAANEITGPGKTVEPSAITAINQLHARYATYSARPGRAVRFFRNLIEDLPPGTAIDPDMVTESFARETGLPLLLLRDSEQLNLTKTKDWFESRIIGQSEPVDLIVDLLAVVKSNLNRQGRPIASLMFIGPTGVGKTQMAKALAEYMYQDEKRMVRFDMSEYKDPYSAARLIGGIGAGEGLLTGKVRENPFTVLLLDEFEKAHPSVFDLLLQVLGEGRLTDGFGRLVDFTTCVIIMTSNLGVASFRESSPGFGSDNDRETHYRDHFIRKVQQYVRPEFFNRIDRIVPFAPLDLESVEKIAHREMELVQKRFGIKNRTIQFKVHSSAPKMLAKLGYDARYGARPLKRTINQKLIQPLARQLIQKSFKTPVIVNIHAQSTGIHFSLETVETTRSKQKGKNESETALAELSASRRRVQALFNSPGSGRIRNNVHRQQQSLDRALRKYPYRMREEKLYSNPQLLERKQQIDTRTNLLTRVDSLLNEAIATEARIVGQFLNGQPLNNQEIKDWIKSTSIETDQLILDLFLNETDSARSITLSAFSRFPHIAKDLLSIWSKVAEHFEFKTQLFEIRRHDPDAEPTYLLPHPSTPELEGYRADVFAKISDPAPANILGYGINITGDGAFQVFLNESGVHRFKRNSKLDVLVTTSGRHIRHSDLPEDIENLPRFDKDPVVRTVNFTDSSSREGTVRIKDLDSVDFEEGNMESTIAEAIVSRFHKLLNDRIQVWN